MRYKRRYIYICLQCYRFIAELRRPERQAEPHNHIGKRNPCMDFLMVIIDSGIARGRVRTTAATVESRSGHTPNNRLRGTSNLGLPCTYILLDVLLCSIAEYFYELCRILASP